MRRFPLLIIMALLAAMLGTACGSSGDLSTVTAALRTEREADIAAMKAIGAATRGAGPCYQTAAGQYQAAAQHYNAWIRGAAFRLRAGSAITEADLRSGDLRQAATYSSLLRTNAGKLGQVAEFAVAEQVPAALACPFLKELGKAVVEEVLTSLVGKGLDALLGASSADAAAKRTTATQLDQIQWPDLSRLS